MADISLNKVTEKDSTRLITKSGVPYLIYPVLEDTGLVKHGFSTRLGGVSEGIYSSMNFKSIDGDTQKNVMENYKRIGRAIGFELGQIVTTDQTHTTNIRIVTDEDAGKGITKERDYHDVDGLITNVPGLALATFYADCVPLYFLDPVKKAIGLSHSGWRGTVNRMGARTIDKMIETYGTKPSDVIACIGPSICQECYEIGEEVADEFRMNFKPSQIDDILLKNKNNKYQLNLWRANQIILEEAGIGKNHITAPDVCTCCNKDILFSHRGLHGKRGNLGAFLMLV